MTTNYEVEHIIFPGSVAAGFLPAQLLAIDVNRDGHLDLVGTAAFLPLKDEELPLTVFLGDGTGKFTLQPTGAFFTGNPGSIGPKGMLVADFNGDGLPDIFLPDHGYDAPPFPGRASTLLLGSAGGGFVHAVDRVPGDNDFSHSATIGDIDDDGDLDIFVGALGAPFFLINDGTANFAKDTGRIPAALQNSAHTGSLLVDIDGDGDLDLFLGAGAGPAGSHVLLLNDGTGNFSESPAVVPDGSFGAGNTIVQAARAYDFNRDGIDDILIGSTGADPFYTGTRLQILIASPDGSLVDQTDRYVDSQAIMQIGHVSDVKLVDLNNDGFLDIYVETSGQFGGTLSYINDGLNRFYQTPELFDPAHIMAETIADLNGDGWADMVHWRLWFDEHSLFVHLKTPVPPGEMTGTDGNDVVLAGPGRQTIRGLGGDDFLVGGGDNDILWGGPGNDTLLGGAGTDMLVPGEGSDIVNGGPGIDTANFGDLAQAVTVNLADGTALSGDATKVLVSIENVIGTAFDDRIEGDGRNNAFSGGEGADILIGRGGNDLLDAGGTREGAANFLLGGAGNDTYIVRNASDVVGEAFFAAEFAGLPGDFDTIVSHADFWWDFYHVGQKHVIAEENPHAISAMIGSLFGSEMVGNSGDNIIFTVGGDNVVRPGAGVDWIALGNVEGFTGTDTLVLEKPAGAAPSWAVVYDFMPGEDKVDASGLDVGSFAAIQAAGFDDEAGNSYYLLDGGSNILFLVGVTTGGVSAGDFIV